MAEYTLQHVIKLAFQSVARPATFTTCQCEECAALNTLLKSREHSTLAANDIGMSLCLLSPEGLTYWTPALIRLCLARERATRCFVCDGFINVELGLPLPREKFPDHHPRFASLNREQTSLILFFHMYVEENWYSRSSEATPRELVRAIRNWRRFAGVHEESNPTCLERPTNQSGG